MTRDEVPTVPGHTVWALAPKDPNWWPVSETVEFVWLLEDDRLIEAVVDRNTGKILATR